MAAQRYLCHLPNLEEARDFVNRSMQANDIQRLMAHVVCLIVLRRPTSALPTPGSRKPSPTKELKASLTGTTGWLLLNQKEEKLAIRLLQKEEELAIRPVPPWDIRLRGGCAQPHTVPGIQKRPQDLFPQRWHQILTPPYCMVIAAVPPQGLEPTLVTDLPRTSGLCPRATSGSLRCSSHNSSRVLFLPKNVLTLCAGS